MAVKPGVVSSTLVFTEQTLSVLIALSALGQRQVIGPFQASGAVELSHPFEATKYVYLPTLGTKDAGAHLADQ